MRKLTFIAGVAVGFVLGARAGREKYERLVEAARKAAESPAVRGTVDAAAQGGRQAAGRAAGVVADRAGGRLPQGLTEKLREASGRPATPMDDDWGSTPH